MDEHDVFHQILHLIGLEKSNEMPLNILWQTFLFFNELLYSIFSEIAHPKPIRLRDPVRTHLFGNQNNLNFIWITPSTLTRNLVRLQEAGLVSRAEDPEDARGFRVSLTEAGRKAAARIEGQEQAFSRTILERIPKERRAAVVEAVSDLLVAVREATEACCPGAFDHLMREFPRGTREAKECNEPAKCG